MAIAKVEGSRETRPYTGLNTQRYTADQLAQLINLPGVRSSLEAARHEAAARFGKTVRGMRRGGFH